MKKMSLKKIIALFCIMYSVLIVLLGFLCISAIFDRRQAEIINRGDALLTETVRTYKLRDESLWSAYLPIYRNNELLTSFRSFFAGNELYGIRDRNNITNTLQSWIITDPDIAWIMLHRGEGSRILYADSDILQAVPADFPYLSSLQSKTQRKEVYGYHGLSNIYAVAGGGIDSNTGSIVVGYKTAEFDTIYHNYDLDDIAHIQITVGHEVIYQSRGEGLPCLLDTRYARNTTTFETGSDGIRYHVRAYVDSGRDYQVVLMIDHMKLIQASLGMEIYLLGLLSIVLMTSALIMNSYLSRRIMYRINSLKSSLEQIGRNDFDAVVERYAPQDEFDQIASSVDHAREKLKISTAKIREESILRKQAEISALQARFNPHFLFNTIEVIRGRLQVKGDDESAMMLTAMTKIFRSLLSTEQFITIREELTFCRNYIQLLKIRKQANLTVRYEVDDDILDHRIIRNILQPQIENCIVHGFANRDQCSMLIRIHKIGQMLEITMANDGETISPERIKEIRERLRGEDRKDDRGYGLFSVARRLHVVYKGNAGIDIASSPEEGTVIVLHIPCTPGEMDADEALHPEQTTERNANP